MLPLCTCIPSYKHLDLLVPTTNSQISVNVYFVLTNQKSQLHYVDCYSLD